MKKLCDSLLTIFLVLALFSPPLRAEWEQEGKVDETLSVVTAVAPTYPPVALNAGIGGEVKVDLTIKVDGTISSAKITSGHRLLREGCESAAKEWKFAEAKGSSGERKAQITFAFFAAAPKTSGNRLTTVFKLPSRIEITRRMNVVTTPQIQSRLKP